MPKPIEKKYYSISEVSEMTAVEISTLRFWENEIPQLAPYKTKGNTRRYRQEDIDLILQIKFLSDSGLYTLEGIRKYLSVNPAKLSSISKAVIQLGKAKDELLAIRREIIEIAALREEVIIDNPNNSSDTP